MKSKMKSNWKALENETKEKTTKQNENEKENTEAECPKTRPIPIGRVRDLHLEWLRMI